MSLRGRFVLYLVVVHLLLAAAGAYLFTHQRSWLLLAELVFGVSLAWGVLLVRELFGTLAFVRQGAQLLDDGDFATRLVEVGQPELDELIRIYNRMMDALRQERVRLQEQHYFLLKILQVSPSGILTFDLDGRLSFANPAAERLLQRPAAELLGTAPGDLPAPIGATLSQLGAGGTRVVTLWGGRRVRCQRGEFLDRGFPRTFVLLEELTEELRAFEKAAYEKLIRMLSHEVNNTVGASNSLLHSCLTYAKHLPQDEAADFRQALQVVIARTEALNQFMRSFAEVARLPAPRREPCDVRALLGRAVDLVQADLHQRSIRVEWTGDESLPAISMDRSQMEQVVLNILRNAIQAIDASPGLNPANADRRITIELGRRAGRPFVVIRDTGAGLSDEARANLFTPFFTTKEEGQGIGLTVVQEILSAHRFGYSLEGPAGGPTEFTIVF